MLYRTKCVGLHLQLEYTLYDKYKAFKVSLICNLM